MLGFSFCSFKKALATGGQKDFSASNTQTCLPQTLSAGSNGAIDSFEADWLQSKMVFLIFRNHCEKTGVIGVCSELHI